MVEHECQQNGVDAPDLNGSAPPAQVWKWMRSVVYLNSPDAR
jgi:hypothetical protein